MDVGVLRAELNLDTNKFQLGVRDAQGQLRTLERDLDRTSKAAQGMQSTADALGSGFKSTVITMGALRFALMDINDIFLAFPKSVAKTSGELERLQVLMQGLSKASTEAARSAEGFRDFNSVINFAKNSPFDVKAISDAFVKFKSAGIDPVTGGMKGLLDSVAKFGGSSEQLQRAAVAIQQMAGKGVVSMEELRQQLGEAVPTAMEALARGTGKSMAELTKLVSSGSVSARSAIAKLMAQLELEAAGSSQRLLQTFPGALAQMKTAFELFENEVGKQGFMTVLTNQLREFTTYLNGPGGRDFAVTLGNGLKNVAEAVVALGKTFGKAIDFVSEFSGSLQAAGLALASVFGGQKLASAVESLQAKFKAIEQASEVAAQRKKVEVQQRLAGLEQERNSIQAQVDANYRVIDAEKAQFDELINKKIAGLQRSAAVNDEVVAREIANLERLKAAQLDLEKQALRADLNAEAVRTYNPGRFQSKSVYSPLQADVQGLAAAKAAIEAEIAATQAAIDKRLKYNETVNARVGALKGETLIMGETTKQAMQMNNEIERQISGLNKQITALETSGGAISKLGAGVRAFAASLGASLLYAGAFALFIEGAILLYERLTKSARDAEEQANRTSRALANQSTKKDVEADTALLAQLERQREGQEAALARNTSNAFDQKRRTGFTNPGTQLALDEGQKNLDDINAKIDQVQRRLQQSSEQVDRDRVKAEVFNALNRISDQSQDASEVQAIVKKRQDLNEQLLTAEKDGLKDVATKLRPQVEATSRELRQAQITVLDRLSSAELEKITDPKVRDRFVSAVKDERAKLLEQLKAVEKPGVELVNNKNQPKSEIDNAIAAEDRRLQTLATRGKTIADGYITVSELLAEARQRTLAALADGKLDDKDTSGKNFTPTVNSAKVLKYMDLLGKVLVEEQLNKIEEEINRFNQRSKVAIDETSKIFMNNAPLIEPGKGILGLEKEFAKLDAVPDLLERALAKIGTTVAAFKASMRQSIGLTDIAAEISKLRTETEQLRVNSIEDELVRERTLTQQKIIEVNRRKDVEIAALGDRATWTQDTLNKVRVYEQTTADYIVALQEDTARRTRGPIEQMATDWAKGMQSLRQASTRWIDRFVNDFVDGTTKVRRIIEHTMGDILKSIATAKIKETLSQSIGGALTSLTNFIGSSLGIGDGGAGAKAASVQKEFEQAREAANLTLVNAGLSLQTTSLTANVTAMETSTLAAVSLATAMEAAAAAAATSAASDVAGSVGDAESILSMFAFANGGIMTKFGPAQLRAYANGGIANSAQIAVYGEGSRPEAFVPLPDGRTIPVTMRGGTADAQMPAVQVNVINQTSQSVNAQQGDMRFDGERAILDLVLTAAHQPGNFRDGMKNALGV